MRFADILLPVPFPPFTYRVPPEWEATLCVGSRVLVQLGKKKEYAGIVMRLHDEEPQGIELKDLIGVLDAEPMVTSAQLQFWHWLSDYYMAPLGDVYKAAMPGLLKKDDTPKGKQSRKSPNPDPAALDLTESPRPLTEAQQRAYDEIVASWRDRDITLLHGVTSSGKTEIYIHLIRRAIADGRQVLYLLPEIALTTQITERLRRVFGTRMGVYHSKFSDRQRADIYRRQLSDAPYDLILGVRSSVLLPFQRLGLVIVDEEHETSYKQQEPAPRYHARNAALMLARQQGAKTLLGTATPSIETAYHAQAGHYGHVTLSTRYAGIELPTIEVVDIRRLRFQKRMKGAFSPRLLEAIGQALQRQEQVILFQNRRGFSSYLQCRKCGWVPRCLHCDVSLTYHKRTGQLVCHYCGAAYALPPQCPDCQSTADLSPVGAGTERVEEQIAAAFPEARVLRMDLDTARTRTAYERIIGSFSDGQADILIGTQMVTKGLDFDRVSVVGILDADTLLNLSNFRAAEHAFQMLSQVAGRAGRKGRQGTVILQTRSAESNIVAQVTAHDYAAFFASQLAERELFLYPPFARLIDIYLRHRDRDVLEHLADDLAAALRPVFGDRLLGPTPPVVGRVASLYIRKIMLKLPPDLSPASVRRTLLAARDSLLSRTVANGLQVYFDVDPV